MYAITHWTYVFRLYEFDGTMTYALLPSRKVDIRIEDTGEIVQGKVKKCLSEEDDVKGCLVTLETGETGRAIKSYQKPRKKTYRQAMKDDGDLIDAELRGEDIMDENWE